MQEQAFNASRLFGNAHRFIEAYHTTLQPICKNTGLPPMAVDILLFLANNPQKGTATDICQCRGLKAGIVSVHIDRLVKEGFLTRQEIPQDRRKTQLCCTEQAKCIIRQGRELQKTFAQKLVLGLTETDISIFRHCLSILNSNIERIRNATDNTAGGKQPCGN